MARFRTGAAIVVAGLLAGLLAIVASPPADAHPARKKPGKRHKHVLVERHVVATRGGQPNVQALGALVLDDGGRTIFARNPDKERPIASISKLAATLVVVDKGIELEGLSTINRSDIEVAKGGARSRLLEGMTLSNRDLLHSALMGSDNRAIPALGRAVKLTPAQLTTAMNAKARALGLKNTRFHEPTGLSTSNVSTPRETIMMLKAAVADPVLSAITRRAEYDAHPVGKPPIHYNNTNHPAQRSNVQVLGGKTGYNDDARYCLVVATKIEGRIYYMAFLGDDGKLTRFGDVARVADWLVSHPQKRLPEPVAIGPAGPPGSSGPARPHLPLPVGVAAPETLPEAPPIGPATIGPATIGPAGPGPAASAGPPKAPEPPTSGPPAAGSAVPAQAAIPTQSASSGAPSRSAVQ
jgi:serine-type D-Ala-D-Ala endopeptidase (penicillin-binding protein 7)